jgi:arylsulfatase A-like enzyme
VSVVLALAAGACAAEPQAPPNVLFIAVDDLNDWVGHLGGRAGVQTPNLDRLAGQGVAFTRAYAPAVSCTPSRQSVLTGLRPSTTGIYGLVHFHWREVPMLRDVVTLPQLFRQHGYYAAGGGKVFHALSWIDRTYGRNQNDTASWDDYYPSVDRPMPEEVRPSAAARNQGGAEVWTPAASGTGERRVPPWYFDWAPLDQPDSAMADHKVVDWAVSQLNRSHNRPFFLAVGLYRPHIPWFAPRSYFERYPLGGVTLPAAPPGDLDDLPPSGRRMGAERRGWHEWVVAEGLWPAAVQAYLASVTFTDAQVGRLLDALAASRYADNTIIVLWSDHGFHLGEKRTWEKFTLWEESTRVPFIIVAPGVSQRGGRANEPVNLIDLYPTLAELAGLEPPGDLEGQSLVPLLRDPDRETGRAVVSTASYNNHTVRSKRWRYIRYEDGSEELYDHDADPDEHRNLAADERYRAVMDQLAAQLPELNVAPARPGEPPSDSTR